MAEPYLRVESLVKRFGPFTALGGVDLEVYPGEVHALLGDNGAGKSTLIKTLAGVHQPTEGQIYIEGKPVNFRSPRDASAAGIGTVYQDLALNQLMSVTRNFFMGREMKNSFGMMKMDEMDKIAHDEMLKIGIDFSDPTQAVGTMSGGQRQTLAIARAIYFGAKVLILDEPTKGVDIGTRSSVYKLLQAAADDGLGVVVISSDFEELLGLAERVVVISDGLSIADLPAEQLSEDKLALLAAPRTSTARNQAILNNLTQTHGGEAFWCLIDEEQTICLAHAGERLTGMGPGQALQASETKIMKAIQNRGDKFVSDKGLQSLLTQMSDSRGHDLGWIGLTLPNETALPEPAVIREHVLGQSRTNEEH